MTSEWKVCLSIFLGVTLLAAWPASASAQFETLMQTPVSPQQIDPSATAQWLAGEYRTLEAENRETQAQWVLWTNEKNSHPGHNGMSFGEGKAPGPRHLRIGFQSAVPVGSMITRGGGRLSVLKSEADYPGDLGDDSQWLPAQRIVAGEVSSQEAHRDQVALWVLPPQTTTRALRFTHVADPADAKYEGWLGGAMVLADRFASLESLAIAAAGSNHRYADRFTNGKHDQWTSWDNMSVEQANASARPVISADSPEWIMLTWPEQVKLDQLITLWTGFAKAEVQAYQGDPSRHPRDAVDSDWQSVGTYDGLENGYPVQLWPCQLAFPETIETRAIRLKITEFSIARHSHVRTKPADGKRIWLGELFACRKLDDKPLASLPILSRSLAKEEAPHAPIPVKFHLPQAGYVSLVIEDSTGKRIRNLVSEAPFPAGDNIAWWDAANDLGRDVEAAEHGLYHIPSRLVEPGQYRVRGLWHRGVEPFYEFSVYASGNPPWSTPDHTGAWLANHSPPSSALFVPAEVSPTGEPSMFLGCYVTEGPDGFAWVDLDGTKRGGMKWIGGNWTAAPFLGRDTGPQVSDAAAYVASVWSIEKGSSQSELRVTALTRQDDQLATKPVVIHNVGDMQPSADRFEQLGGLAAYNGVIVCSLRQANQLLWIDAQAGEVLGTSPLESPRGVVFDSAGQLLALSGNRLVSFAEARHPDSLAKPEVVIEGLDDPFGIALDQAGAIYISQHGTSHQVKVFSAEGAPIRTIGHAGVPQAGKYDPLHMNHPAGIAVDSQGQLWVTEHDYLPKRVSIWSHEGEFVRAIYGPSKYGGGGMLDSHDRQRFYYADEARGALEFRLDWEQGSADVERILYRSSEDFPLPFRAAAPETPLYRGEQRYFTNCYNSSPTGGHSTALLFQDREGSAKPVAAMGTANYWPLLQTKAFLNRWPEETDPTGNVHQHNKRNQAFFIWCDQNTDAQVQPAEVHMTHAPGGGVTVMADLSFCVSSLAGKAIRFSPTRFTSTGVPIYELAHQDVLAEGVQRPASSGGNQVLADDSGEAVITLGVEPFHAHSLSGTTQGKPTWSYPSPWPGLHASHRAAEPDQPGQVIGSTRLLGGLFQPKGSQVEPLWAINGNMGNFYLFTRDGLFVSTLFEDVRQGKLWKMPQAVRGMSLAGISLHDENFWPSITSTSDGKVYAVDGSNSSLVRLEGLETLRPIDPIEVEVTPEHLQQAQSFVVAREARRQEQFGKGILMASLTRRPDALTIDGEAHDWRGASWVEIDKRGVAANFNANSRPYNVRGAMARGGDRLYIAWKTTEPELLRNSGELPQALFKTGGALDLMLGTQSAASPERKSPVKGDLRLLVTQVESSTRALLYRPVAPAAESKPVPFSSPWRTITFDQVIDVSKQVELATDNNGFYELSIPLDLLDFHPQAGETYKGDLGVLRGNGSETTSRTYWSNKATGITADVPSEAALTPSLWGTIQWQAGAK